MKLSAKSPTAPCIPYTIENKKTVPVSVQLCIATGIAFLLLENSRIVREFSKGLQMSLYRIFYNEFAVRQLQKRKGKYDRDTYIISHNMEL